MTVIFYFSSLIIEPCTFSYQIVLSVFLVVIGLACALPSFWLFTKHKKSLNNKIGFAIVTLSWVTAAFAGSLPFYLTGAIPVSYTHLTLPTIYSV